MSKYMENAELVMKFFDKNGWGPYNMLDDGCAARFFGEIHLLYYKWQRMLCQVKFVMSGGQNLSRKNQFTEN